MQNEGAKIQHQPKISSRFIIATTASKILEHQSLYKPHRHSAPMQKYDAEVFTIAYATATKNSYSVLHYLSNKVFSINFCVNSVPCKKMGKLCLLPSLLVQTRPEICSLHQET